MGTWNVRVRLICTLSYELEIDADALPVVLSLTAVVAAQDQAVQEAIIAAMEPNAGSSEADNS